MTRYWLVMPAAGTGLRFGGDSPKQHVSLAGRTVLDRALQLFCEDPACQGIVLALSAADLADAGLRGRLPAKIEPVLGGSRRCDSVLAALSALGRRAAPEDWVLVHDAARPCLSAGDLRRLLREGAGHRVGALLAAPVTDTLKQQADEQLESAGTVDRRMLWRALTPQMFRFDPLCAALRGALGAGREPTDEAQAMEWQGGRPLLVVSHDNNIKITGREDLELAQAILAARAVPADRTTESAG